MNGEIGFTTMTFKPALQAGTLDLPELFQWGADRGFSWVEVRDFDSDFSEDQVRQIRMLAEDCGLRPHYAWDSTSLFAGTDQERIRKGIERAALFGAGTCSRIVIAPERIGAETGTVDYSAADLAIISGHIRDTIAYAVGRGVIPVFENSVETLRGFDALLEDIPEMRMTLDSANSFVAENTGEPLTWPMFRDFIIRRRDRIPYVHLKSSRSGTVVPELLENGDVPLAELLSLLNETAWLCVELPAEGTPACCFQRLEDGFERVRRLSRGRTA